MSICGNYYFILTLLGVCHIKVNFVCPLKANTDVGGGGGGRGGVDSQLVSSLYGLFVFNILMGSVRFTEYLDNIFKMSLKTFIFSHQLQASMIGNIIGYLKAWK